MPFPPTRTDPAIVTARDGTAFMAWLEPIQDQLLWVFVSSTLMHYVGPRYGGEDSPEQLRELVGAWWARTKRK